MTYPPGGSGYPGQQPTQQFSAPTQQFKVEQSSQAQAPAQAAAAGPSKLPFYLLIAVAVLGLAVYLFSFGALFTISDTDFPQLGSASGTSLGLGLAVIASLFAGLLAGASLLPKQEIPIGVISAVAVLGFLLVIAEIISKPEGVAIGWALYVVLVLSLLQAAVAIGALLLDAGIISAPVPKPKYESSRSTARTAPRGSTTASRVSTRARSPSAAPGLSGAVRRLFGAAVVRRLPGDRPAERPADAADRLPDLRPAAAGLQLRFDEPGARAAAVVVFVESVR